MTVHLITFCSADMTRAADLCVSSAREHGVDKAHLFTWDAIKGSQFCKDNAELFAQPRGVGLWSWKPYVILEGMKFCEEGDTVVYSDAGIEFINNLNYVIDRMDQDIWLYGNEWPHYMWCKRDIIDAIWPTTTKDLRGLSQDGSFQSAWRRYGNQVQASVIFFRVNDKTRAFVAEWLKWCLTKVPEPSGRIADRIGLSCGHSWQGNNASRCPTCGDVPAENGSRYLIDDSPSFAPNHPEFRENRHDQSILSTLAARDGIKLHPWNVKYLTFEPARREGYPEDDQIPTLFLHHRLRNDCWQEYESRMMR